MSKEIKMEKQCDPRDIYVAENNKNPEREAVEQRMKKMKESIRAKYGNIEPGEFVEGQVPVGTKFNGIEVVKPQTDLNEYEDDSDIFETKRPGSVLKEYAKDKKREEIKQDMSKCTLTESEEKALKEKIIQEKTDKIMDLMQEFSKEYVPREDIDRKRFISEEDMFEIARKIFGVEKHPSRLEKFKKFVQACQKAAEEREQDKKEYVAPECEIVEEGVIPGDFDGICQDLMALHARKNKDYGNAAHESYKEFGLISYVIRLNDKMKRLKSLTKPGVEQEVKSESIEDTLMDLAAYAIMAIESLRS